MKLALLVRFSCLLAASTAALQAQEKAAPPAPAQSPNKPSPKQKPAADPFIKAPGVTAEPATPPAPFADIILQYDWIDVARDDFMALVRENPVAPDANAVRRELQTWIQQGKARLAQLDLLVTRSGQRSVSQSVREIRHPLFPSQLEAPEHYAGGKDVSFNVRQHGWDIEVEVVAGADGRSFTVNCVPQWTDIGGETWTASKLPGAQPGDVLVPAIRVGKVSTCAILQIDTWHLFWAGRAPLLPDAPVKMRVLFIRAAFKVGPPAQPRRSTGNLVVETDWIDVPLTALNEWVFAQPLAQVPTGLPEQARSWLAAGKAKRRAADITPTQSGQRAVGEAIDEHRYASEYQVTRDGRLITDAVETRNVGATVEYEPVASPDGGSIDLNIAPQLVSYLGETVHHRAKSGAPDVTSPIFYSMKTTSSFSVAAETPWLLATQTPPGKDGAPDPTTKTVVIVTVHR